MDDIVDSEQLAELESLLYSQIHHSVDVEPTLPEMPLNSTSSCGNTPGKPRYFGTNQQPTPKQQTYQTNSSEVSISSSIVNETISKSSLPSELSDSVPAVYIHQEINFNVQREYTRPVNKIVIIPPNDTAENNILSRNQRKRLNRRLRKQHDETIQKAINDAEAFKHLNKDDRAKVLKLQKRQTYLTRRKEKQKLLKQQELIRKFNNEVLADVEPKPIDCEAVIELSETDEDEIVALEQNYDTVLVSSDDEVQPIKTEKVLLSIVNDDDNSVQFIETPTVEPIVLDLEPEPQPGTSKTDAELMKPPSDETTSISSAASVRSNDKSVPVTPSKSPRVTQRRIREVINTPESSNDFLDNTLYVSDQNFNFSLHGNDLVVEKSFLKPRSLAELYESESSCSASDISSVKNQVFNELEFESPAKPLFAEADLETFSDFITPKRKSGGISTLLSSSVDATQSKQIAAKALHLRSASDSNSSSESDFEDCVMMPNAGEKPKRKRLPSLSHFDVDETQGKSTPISKSTKHQKVVKAQNKFDFIKEAGDESAKQDAKTSEKKNKKRKQKSTESEDTEKPESEGNKDETVDPRLGTAKKKKKQKKTGKAKSDTEVEERDITKTPSQKSLERSSDKSDSDVDDLMNMERSEENNDLVDPKLSAGKKRKRSRGKSEKSKSDTEVEKNIAKTPLPKSRKNSTKSDSEVDDHTHENTKKTKKKRGTKSDNEVGLHKSLVSEGLCHEIESGPINTTPQLKKKRNNKSESDCSQTAAQDDPAKVPEDETQSRLDISRDNETETVATLSTKKRKGNKSDNESTFNIAEKQSIVNTTKSKKQKIDKSGNESVSLQGIDHEKAMETSTPTKRKKRPRTESNPSDDQEVINQEKQDTSVAIVVEDVAVEAVDVSDVEIIELPVEIIDLSDDDNEQINDDNIQLHSVKSSEEEEHFDCEDLNNLRTDLELSNVAESSWDVLEVLDTSIVYDATKKDSPDVSTIVDTDVTTQSWNIPGFDADRVRETLSDDPSRWKVMERDRVHIPVVERGPRCHRCREFGHIAFNCDRKQTRCWLCGTLGHQEPRCPNTMCTNCGRSTRFFTANCGRCKDLVNNRCSYCDCKGHLRYLCPDAWRRYYLTTEPGEFVLPRLKSQYVLKPNKERWCSGCSHPGHLEHNCSYYNRTHAAIIPYIFKYEDIYKKTRAKRKRQTESDALVLEVQDEDRNDVEEVLADNDDVVEHKQMSVTLEMELDTAQIFVNNGMRLAKELFNDLHVTQSFRIHDNKGVLSLQGYPTDLHNVQRMMKDFIKEPTSSMREVKLSNREWESMQSKSDLMKKVESCFAVSTRRVNLSKVVILKGTVFNMLLAENYLLHALNIGERTKTISTKSQDSESFVLPKMIIDNILSHPHMKILAEKFSVEWRIKKNSLTLVGTKSNINMIKNEMGDFQSSKAQPTYGLLRKINTLITYAEFPCEAVNGLYELLRSNRIEILNVLLYGGVDGQVDCKLEQLKSVSKMLSSNMFLSRKCKPYHNTGTGLVHFFKMKRSPEIYADLINSRAIAEEKVSKSAALNLYSLGESPERRDANCFFVQIMPSHTLHLLNTPQGNDFLNELNSSCPMELNKDKSTLYLYCSEAQREAAMKRLNFYFFILDQPFPKIGSEICAQLLRRFAQAKLDYYTTNCRELLRHVQQSGAEKYDKLHGLLFAKYELMDGRVHKDAVNCHLQLIMHKETQVESVTDYRNIKTAAMHLFCSRPLAVDYEYLVSLAVPPVVPEVPDYQYSETLASVSNVIKHAREKYSNPLNIWKMAEIKVLDEYLLKNANSKESLAVVSAFLKDNLVLS